MSNEGFANLAAAVLSFFGSRYKARREERKQKEKEDREDKRLSQSRDFLKEMETIRGNREASNRKEDIDFKREALDRVYPKKGFLDRLMDSVQGALKGPSAQDKLADAQAGLFNAQAGLINRTPAGMRGTGMQMPSNNGRRRTNRATGEPTSTLVDPGTFFKEAAKSVVTGVISGFRKNGRSYDPKGINWSGLLKMKRGKISEAAGKDLSDDELEIIRGLIEGDEETPGIANSLLMQTKPKKSPMRNLSGSAR